MTTTQPTLLTTVSLPVRRPGVDITPSAGTDFSPVPANKHSDGWDGNAFYFCGKKYVVAISPEISKNGLHELRTYRYDDDKQAVPSEKLTTIVTEPLKQRESTRTLGTHADNIKPADKKCLFCGKPVTWGNKKTRYCSDGCRTAAYRERKGFVNSKVNDKNMSDFQKSEKLAKNNAATKK